MLLVNSWQRDPCMSPRSRAILVQYERKRANANFPHLQLVNIKWAGRTYAAQLDRAKDSIHSTGLASLSSRKERLLFKVKLDLVVYNARMNYKHRIYNTARYPQYTCMHFIMEPCRFTTNTFQDFVYVLTFFFIHNWNVSVQVSTLQDLTVVNKGKKWLLNAFCNTFLTTLGSLKKKHARINKR
jgi:hypothetical protein